MCGGGGGGGGGAAAQPASAATAVTTPQTTCNLIPFDINFSVINGSPSGITAQLEFGRTDEANVIYGQSDTLRELPHSTPTGTLDRRSYELTAGNGALFDPRGDRSIRRSWSDCGRLRRSRRVSTFTTIRRSSTSTRAPLITSARQRGTGSALRFWYWRKVDHGLPAPQ